MSVRLCPRCSTLIESNSVIFCYNCGQELEGSLTESLGPTRPGTATSPKSVPAKSQSFSRQILVVLTLILFLFLFVSLTYLKFSQISSSPISQNSDPGLLVSTLAALPLSPLDFGRNNFPSITPADVDYYLEGSNPKFFLDQLLRSEEKDQISALTGLSLEEVTSFFDPNFAFVKSASASAFLSVGRDIEFLKERSQKLIGQAALDFLVIENYYIVANSAELLQEISNVYNQASLPLSLTSKFQEIQKKLPSRGQIFIYSKDEPSLRSALAIYFGGRLNADLTSLPASSLVVTAADGSAALDFP